MIDYNTPQDIIRVLAAHDLRPQKRFGQNFMINPGARRQIIDHLGLGAGAHIWEIGPGLGALTSEALARDISVRAFEIDRGYLRILEDEFGSNPNFSLVAGDARKTWHDWKHEKVDALVGNLPYNVGTAMLTDFLEAGFLRRMVITVQREVAERMRAQADSSNYGSFSVFCQTFTKVSVPLVLKPGSFFPAPEVSSAVVVLEPRNDIPDLGDAKVFDRVLRAAFSSRRKTLRNNFRQSEFANLPGLDPCLALLETLGISPDARAETLSPLDFAHLSAKLTELL